MKPAVVAWRFLPAAVLWSSRLRGMVASVLQFSKARTPNQKAAMIVALLAAVVASWNVLHASAYQDDEGTYTAQALSSLNGSLAPYTYWYDHPPLGWLQLAVLSWIPTLLGHGDETAVGQMRYVVGLFFVATTLLVFLLARRLRASLPFAIMGALLFCLSPLSLVLGRQVFIDNVGIPWLLLAFYLALSLELKLWHHIGAGACFAVAVLSKETLAIFGPALLLALLHRPYWQTRFFSVIGFLSVGGLVLAFFPLLAVLRGELIAGAGHVSLQDALRFQFLSRPGSGSLFDPSSGRTELVGGWLYYDSYLILIGMGAALLCLLRREARWIPAALLLFSAPVVIGHGYLPAMYIVAAIPLLALAIAIATDIAWATVSRLFPRVPYRGRHAAKTKSSAGLRLVSVGVAGTLTALVLGMLIPAWYSMNRGLLTNTANDDWHKALQWSQQNLPREDVALVPYSMWQDINADGRHDPWKVIALEKMDLDTEYDAHHPGGWRSIDWIVEGPPTVRNIENLALKDADVALQNSRVVVSFGEWRIREVLPDGASPTLTGEKR
ncbi:hypothetical protein E7744_04220 [Citricoccus sp. SGAir0253]|uniref:glycosyltransferase family 39 protein n=1 Tax=Citricoccus sp. SGAir0253 TaxID=2567881 RepID=UPI0010CCC192|nr:glycosyltransferase family 39 protein [Citricoccus sp. SGAir0253]QCU77512.1 hypothetical protein E7744_04220 [Citricoccus sp. SGAir0253]